MKQKRKFLAVEPPLAERIHSIEEALGIESPETHRKKLREMLIELCKYACSHFTDLEGSMGPGEKVEQLADGSARFSGPSWLISYIVSCFLAHHAPGGEGGVESSVIQEELEQIMLATAKGDDRYAEAAVPPMIDKVLDFYYEQLVLSEAPYYSDRIPSIGDRIEINIDMGGPREGIVVEVSALTKTCKLLVNIMDVEHVIVLDYRIAKFKGRCVDINEWLTSPCSILRQLGKERVDAAS